MSIVGRWRANSLGKEYPPAERQLRNDIHRHEEQLIEWLLKRNECATAIVNHRRELYRLTKRAKRLGVAL